MRCFVLLLLPFVSIAQLPLQKALPIDSLTKTVAYRRVASVDSTGKDELYSRSKMWIAKYYTSTDVVQVDDKENGVIFIKSKFDLPSNQFDGYIQHSLRISLKDGRYKVEFTDLVFYWWVPFNAYVPGSPYWSHYTLEQCYPIDNLLSKGKMHKKMVIEATNEMDSIIKELISTLDTGMRLPLQTSDW